MKEYNIANIFRDENKVHALAENLAQEAEVITFLSAGNVSYDGRALYLLHFKEGFFKLVLTWNQQHADTISFEQAINAYEKYEITVLEKCRRKWQDLQDIYGQITKVENGKRCFAGRACDE